VVRTIGFKLLYGFVIVRIDRRDLVWINVKAYQTAEGIARQITEAFPWDGAPRYMIRDRDRIYSARLHRPHPGRMAFAERLIGSSRQECFGSCGDLGRGAFASDPEILRRLLQWCQKHRSLNKYTPVSHPVQRIARRRESSAAK
jgi:hypothetical protein